jgi:hypothetical protein
MVDQAPLTADDLRVDARNTLRLAEIAGSERLKTKLLRAANEFLNKAAELEAGTIAIVTPAEGAVATKPVRPPRRARA